VKPRDRFPVESKQYGVMRRLEAQAVCSACGFEQWEHVKNPGWAVRVFKGRGWRVGPRRADDLCPNCAQASGRAKRIRTVEHSAPRPGHGPDNQAKFDSWFNACVRKDPARHLRTSEMHDCHVAWAQAHCVSPLTAYAIGRFVAALGIERFTSNGACWKGLALNPQADRLVLAWREAAIAHPPAPQINAAAPPLSETKVTATPDRPAAAAAPREPTVSDNRRIRDALEEHYDDERGRYRGAMSDAKLSQVLDLPRAWVTRIRDQFCGPDTNEAAAARRDTIAMAHAATSRIYERAMAMAEEADALLAELNSAKEAAGRIAETAP
jgi:hypothetical protein